MCIRVTVAQAEAAYRDVSLRTWIREDEPEKFEIPRIDEMAGAIIQVAEDFVDALGAACPPGGVRFLVRTHQHLGARENHWIRIESASDPAMQSQVGGFSPDATGLIGMQMSHNMKLVDANQKLTAGSIGMMLDMQTRLNGENAELRAKVTRLEGELAAARNDDEHRLMDGLSRQRADDRKDKLLGKILPMVPVVLAKILSKAGGPGGNPALAMLVNELAQSLTQQQIGRIMSVLTPPQMMQFGEAMRIAAETKAALESGEAKASAQAQTGPQSSETQGGQTG